MVFVTLTKVTEMYVVSDCDKLRMRWGIGKNHRERKNVIAFKFFFNESSFLRVVISYTEFFINHTRTPLKFRLLR